MNPLDQFFATVANAATRLGLKSIAIAAKDPASGEVRFVATASAPAELRGMVADKWGFSEVTDTTWGDHGG